MRIAMLAEVPHQHGHLILALLQIGLQVNLVAISVIRVRSALQTTLKDH